jgi:hypothetical protein
MEYHKYILASECFDEEEKKKAKKDLVDIIVEVRELPKWVIVKCNFNGCIDKIQSYHKICLLLEMRLTHHYQQNVMGKY